MRRKVYAPLRRAGLEVIEGGVPEHALPAFVIGAVVSCGPDTGRRDAYLDHHAPRLVERANQGWYELVTDFGLFGADREFLLALPAHCYGARAASRHRRHVWRRVRLLDGWDVMGAACAIALGPSGHGYPEYILGVGAGHPGFGMLSLDSSVAVVGATWQAGISSLAVPDPGGQEVVRAMLEGAATREWDPREEWLMGAPRAERAEALAWLRRRGWTGTPAPAPEPPGRARRHL